MAIPDMPAIEAWTPLPHDPPCDRELGCVDYEHHYDLARVPNEDGGIVNIGYDLPGGCQFTQPTFGLSIEWDEGGVTPAVFTISDTITLVSVAEQFLKGCGRKYDLTSVVDTRPAGSPAAGSLLPRRPWWRRQIARAAQPCSEHGAAYIPHRASQDPRRRRAAGHRTAARWPALPQDR